eukprot:GAHX01004222.1.p1 GENE.GAHX01004222.1~~GAHX01004222.1.p1  ORF type:complete len:67 (-),score=5.32 GAHX01004222.1:77-277(-)
MVGKLFKTFRITEALFTVIWRLYTKLDAWIREYICEKRVFGFSWMLEGVRIWKVGMVCYKVGICLQ